MPSAERRMLVDRIGAERPMVPVGRVDAKRYVEAAEVDEVDVASREAVWPCSRPALPPS